MEIQATRSLLSNKGRNSHLPAQVPVAVSVVTLEVLHAVSGELQGQVGGVEGPVGRLARIPRASQRRGPRARAVRACSNSLGRNGLIWLILTNI